METQMYSVFLEIFRAPAKPLESVARPEALSRTVLYNLRVLKHCVPMGHILIWGYRNILSSKIQTRKIEKFDL